MSSGGRRVMGKGVDDRDSTDSDDMLRPLEK